MVMPRINASLTPENVLAWMESDREYLSSEISSAFKVESKYVWDMLKSMHKAGDIEKRKGALNMFLYSKPCDEKVVLNTSFAGPKIGPNLTSTLYGYGDEMKIFMQLCMLSR